MEGFQDVYNIPPVCSLCFLLYNVMFTMKNEIHEIW